MSVDLQSVANLLAASLDPRQNKQAEQSLKSAEAKPGFSLALLQIVAAESFPINTRLASALFFKNFVRRNWTNEDGEHQLPANEVSTIKSELIGLMVKVPSALQAQLGDAISVIADSDFWERWDTLVDDLVSRLTPDNANVNNGVLQVAHSIFKRWEPLYRSDELYTEINHVLSKFAGPFLQLWENTDRQITENENNPVELQAHFSTLDLIIKLMYDLSTHDMPPQFEDSLGVISTLLHKYLTYENPALDTGDEAEPGPREQVRADVFRVLVLYTRKYDEEFKQYITQFIGTSWNLLTTLGPEANNDLVVSRALEFLTTIAGIQEHAQNFNSPEVLGQVTEKVVIPNLSLRESDIETFEDEPIEYIRRDLEGSDDDTRRRAATNFLRKLMEAFEKPVTEVVTRYVDHFLGEYRKDQSANWKAKDTAVHLFSAIAAKGTATAAKGILSVNPYVSVIDFFQKNVAEDLTNPNAEALLKVDAIKYLYLFRSILSADQWQAAFPLLVQHLNSSNYVVYTYAAIAVDRALYLTDEQRQPIIPRESIIPLAKDLLQHLFKLVTKDAKPEKVQENEFLMKCVMRVLIVIREAMVDIVDLVLTNLVNITKVIRHNPSNPGFCYYHFESLGALIRFAGPTQPEKIESSLFPTFMEVLQGQVEEFSPYIFQLYALMVATNPSGQLSSNFQRLVQPILVPTMWDSRGNVPALTRLLVEIIPRGAEQIAAANQTEALLVIFQKLVSSKAYETHAMDLIEAIVRSFSVTALENYWQSILQLMFHRLSNSKTENFTIRFVRFYHLVSALVDKGLGADFFIAVADKVQANVFTPIYTTIILPDTQKLSRPFDRKTACISLTRTLADSQAFVDRYAKRGWTITCEALLKLLINPPLPQAADDTIEDRDVDELGFGAAFTQLNACKRPASDPWPEVQDVKAWVGTTLKEADQRHNGRIGQFVQGKLDDQGRAALQSVMLR
ncbi:Importin alpha re-exporter [Fulvia fulva]|uniref:Importin alpha re-exporter n=1 Tax=Passalora fulva TaxID=5499 RepID=A0A9Q8P545_PASFU|nr:Importin alpha re-exporter [Fulvia fulva]KAK4630943.1 Importin alpha re-exporter [Fulvia fulva]KAK4633281.1 Importin alpha re-exporter [Fulvia fulva]UJO13755.1 Importin alpha re-exporter [Fulvia fulva]WPV10571.1 Importin alpha re-exporter [Fulvia fulva]WPV26614.1 Importin alpha re-exporter [Fulvia fulva]